MLTHFSKEERLVLTIITAVLLIGTVLHVTFQQYPQLRDMVNVIEDPRVVPKLNINTASYEELVDVPFIGPVTAKSILRFRKRQRFTSIEQARTLPGVLASNYDKFSKYIEVKE